MKIDEERYYSIENGTIDPIKELHEIMEDIANKEYLIEQQEELEKQQELLNLYKENKELNLIASKVDKKLITVQEFESMFNLGRETQKQLRNRIKHPYAIFSTFRKIYNTV